MHNEEYSDALAIINHQDSELGFVARHDNEYESDEEYDIVTASADVVTSTRTTVTANTNSRGRSANYSADELKLCAKAYMTVSSNAKEGTDKKADAFWEQVIMQYEKLAAQVNKIHESTPHYKPLPPRTSESLRGTWKKKIQPAVQKFVGLVRTIPPKSGELYHDKKMDLYYSTIRELYASRINTWSSSLPRKFDILMNSYEFLSEHSKFEVEFPKDGPPLSAKKTSKASKQAPTRKDRPLGREASKKCAAIAYVVDKVTTKVATAYRPPNWDAFAEHMSAANEHLSTMVQFQVISHASPQRKKQFFDEISSSMLLTQAKKRKAAELEQQRLELEAEELEVKKLELAARKAKIDASHNSSLPSVASPQDSASPQEEIDLDEESCNTERWHCSWPRCGSRHNTPLN